MSDFTTRAMANVPYAFADVDGLLDDLRVVLQMAAFDGVPCQDAYDAVTKAKYILERASARLERKLWALEEPSPSFVLDAPEDEADVLPFDESRRASKQANAGNRHA